jgi:TonB family protein
MLRRKSDIKLLIGTLVAMICLSAISISAQSSAHISVAVVDFGSTPAGARAAEAIRKDLADESIVLIDPNLAITAARGNGFQGSMNLSTQEARDLGAAIGCDFFIIGDAQTVARSPANGVNYFESYAAIFIVSARTGRLIYWERPSQKSASGAEAESALLTSITSDEAAQRFRRTILGALASEAAERAAAVEAPPTAIEVMSDDDNKTDTRAPRPYRRVKPSYPEAAAQAEIEATVDALVDIDARGEITRLEIARWAGYGLDQSVLDTVKQMHFFPAMRDGLAIPMRVLLRYNFQRKPAEGPVAKPIKITVPTVTKKP